MSKNGSGLNGLRINYIAQNSLFGGTVRGPQREPRGPQTWAHPNNPLLLHFGPPFVDRRLGPNRLFWIFPQKWCILEPKGRKVHTETAYCPFKLNFGKTWGNVGVLC